MNRNSMIAELELEPFLGIFDGDRGFIEADEPLANPSRKVFKVCELGSKKFNELAKESKRGMYEDMEYWPKSDAGTWWNGGMQRLIVQEVILVSDGTDDYIYVFYYKMNHREYGALLGRLRPGSEIERIIKEAFDTLCI